MRSLQPPPKKKLDIFLQIKHYVPMINKNYKIVVINIGNELLNGRTTNTNLTTIGEKLLYLSTQITEAYIISDDHETIVNTLKRVWQKNTIVIITGGLGPTNDDITKTALASFFEKEMVFHEIILEDIKNHFNKRNIDMPEINNIQAMIPDGFLPLRNFVGTAPGMYYKNANRHLFSLPGVPYEMEHLFDFYVTNMLQRIIPKDDFTIFEINTHGISESLLAEKLADLDLDENVNIAWLPHLGRVDIRLYGTNINGIAKASGNIHINLKDYIWGVNQKSPTEALHSDLLKYKKIRTLSVAESCTGGGFSSFLTSLPGASKYFLGAIVSYSNDAKQDLLSVTPDVLRKYGSVSQEVVCQMIEGCEKRFNSDIVCAITGIAGPDGGSKTKPVGTVFIAVKYKKMINVEKYHFTGSRNQIQQRAIDSCAFMILQILNKI